MEKFLFTWITTIYLFTAPSLASASDFDAWFKQVWVPIQASPQYEGLDSRIKSANFESEAALLRSPWTTTSTLSIDEARPIETENETREVRTHIFSNELKYVFDAGTLASMNLGVNYVDAKNQKNPFVPNSATDAKSRVYTTSASLSHDINREGNRGFSKTSRSRNQDLSLSNKWNIIQAKLDLELQIFRQLLDYYVARCKLERLEDSKELVIWVLKRGEAQVKANLISQTNFLSFKDLETSVERQISGQMSIVDGYVVNLERNGTKFVSSLLKASEKHRFLCSFPSSKDPFAETKNLLNATKIEGTEFPSAVSAGYRKQATEKSAKIQRLEYKPSVSPFVSGQWNNSIDSETETGSVSLGVSFSWNIPGRKGDLLQQSTREELESATKSYYSTVDLNNSIIANLKARLVAAERTYQVIKKSESSSELLLTALKQELAIGTIDPLNYASAALNKISIEQSSLEVWSTITSLHFEVERYSQASKL